MAKKYIILASLLLSICIIAVVFMLFYSNGNEDKNTVDNYDNHNSTTIDELKLYLNSTDELKNDTYNYENKYLKELRNVFDKLNDNTNTLLDAMLDNADVNVEKLALIIKSDEKKLFKILDEAYNSAKSKDYKISYTALKKYIKLQNETIFRLKDVYEKEGSLSYDTYYEMLHTTHDTMTFEETNGINFLSAVDGLIEKNK